MNKRIGTALCTMTALAVVVAVPTAAQAADPFAGAFSTSAQNERVVLFFDTLDAPKGLKVILRRKGGTAPVATLTNFTPVSPQDACEPSCGDPLTHPLQAFVPKLAELGDYSVDVQYTGTMDETVLHKDRATLNYRVRPYFQNLKSANGVSLASPETVVSGDIKTYDPRTESTKPFTGTFTATTGTVTTPLATDAGGHFKSKIKVSGAAPSAGPGDDNTDVRFTAALAGITKDELLQVPVTPVQAHIALDSPTVTGPYGTETKVSGAVTWKAPDGTWQPVPAGALISLGRDGGNGTTDDAGRFTALGHFAGDAVWKGEGATPWLNTDKATVWVDSTTGVFVSDLRAEMDKERRVTVTGMVSWDDIPAALKWLRVDVQTSVDGKTGWTTRAVMNISSLLASRSPESAAKRIPDPGTGFVRLRYAGTPDVHGSVSPAIKIPQLVKTAVTEFDVGPEPVKRGQRITVSGKVTQANPTWKPYSGASVGYYFRPAGETAWKAVGSSTTTAGGNFSRSWIAGGSGSWKVRYWSFDTLHSNSPYSSEDEVVVSP
ncbi:hypothetical protein OTB20_14350 [Streptomyces sp. H27-H1]|uniref:hypothetical protein n=1 Tax=Streptomyces sp. H27-H1 TaxID=2996461 RepID=UPI002271FD7E|nr:hypothetical protein [Streptomyces sp. H27-H1]MCY0927370.1 hypothetical protein [Streptomyces sp. H27-H1]